MLFSTSSEGNLLYNFELSVLVVYFPFHKGFSTGKTFDFEACRIYFKGTKGISKTPCELSLVWSLERYPKSTVLATAGLCQTVQNSEKSIPDIPLG